MHALHLCIVPRLIVCVECCGTTEAPNIMGSTLAASRPALTYQWVIQACQGAHKRSSSSRNRGVCCSRLAIPTCCCCCHLYHHLDACICWGPEQHRQHLPVLHLSVGYRHALNLGDAEEPRLTAWHTNAHLASSKCENTASRWVSEQHSTHVREWQCAAEMCCFQPEDWPPDQQQARDTAGDPMSEDVRRYMPRSKLRKCQPDKQQGKQRVTS